MTSILKKILTNIHDPRNKNYDPSMSIWRYMSFGKFADMVHYKRLFFGRPQSFRERDKFEGHFGSMSRHEKERIARAGYKDLSYEQVLPLLSV